MDIKFKIFEVSYSLEKLRIPAAELACVTVQSLMAT